jgi:hypothetical protein
MPAPTRSFCCSFAALLPQRASSPDSDWVPIVAGALFFVGVAWICRPRRRPADVVVRRPTAFEQHLVKLTEMPTIADAERYAARLRAVGIVALPRAERPAEHLHMPFVPTIVVVSSELDRAHAALERLVAQDHPVGGGATDAEIERDLAEAADDDDDDPIDANVESSAFQQRFERLFHLLGSRWLWGGLGVVLVVAVLYRVFA